MLFYNYSKPGKGVEKRDPNQSRILTFFDILPRKIWFLFKLNFVNILASSPLFVVVMIVVGIVSLPLINIAQANANISDIVKIDTILRWGITYIYMILLGMGPSTAAYLYIVRKTVEERYCWLISDFFEAYKTNFKKSILLLLIDVFVFCLLVGAFKFYSHSELLILQCIIVCVGCIYVAMHIYIYQMIVTFELTFKNILRNAFLLLVMKAPISIIVILLNVIIKIIIPALFFVKIDNFTIAIILVLLDVLFVAPTFDFATNFYIIPMLKKHISNEEE